MIIKYRHKILFIIVMILSFSLFLPVKAGQGGFPVLLMTPDIRNQIENQRALYLLRGPHVPLDDQSDDLDDLVGKVRLSAIINANGRRQAIINGNVYNERQELEGVHVHRIFSSHVTITTNGKWGRLDLGVDYDLANWPSASNRKVISSER